MSLPYRQQRQFGVIEAGLRQSDPQLAAILAMFGRLCAGDRMPAWEELRSGQGRLSRAVNRILTAIAAAATAVSAQLRAALALITCAIRGARPATCPPLAQDGAPTRHTSA
jgi:hypothetical protein